MFAEAVVREAKTRDPIVLVQDYHFALLPRMVRKRLPKATIVTFWHIPWPNAETFGICPWKEEILDGLLGCVDPRLPHRLPLQQFLRDGRPLRREPHRPRAPLGDAGRPRDAGAPLSDLDRVAALGAGRPEAGAGVRRGGAQPLRPRRGRADRRRHRALRLHQGHRRPAARGRCAAAEPSGMAGPLHLHPGGGADPQQDRLLPRAAGRGGGAGRRDQRPPRHAPTGSRSCCRSAITIRRRCSSCSGRPISAWSPACTTA